MGIRIERQRIKIEDLNKDQKEKMLNLMKRYYENTDEEIFHKDLSEKNWVLALYDKENHDLIGFSTQQLFNVVHNQDKYQILFSGDTIVDHKYWGSMMLSLAFAELVLDIKKECNGEKLYWMLISKGLRTYKFLPAYFINYYPCYNKETPEDIKYLMDKLGKLKYPDLYNSQKGVIEAKNNGQYLKPEYEPDDMPLEPQEKFYYLMNPGYKKGDELLCLTCIEMENLNPFIKRAVSRLNIEK